MWYIKCTTEKVYRNLLWIFHYFKNCYFLQNLRVNTCTDTFSNLCPSRTDLPFQIQKYVKWCCSSFFLVNFEKNSHIALVCYLIVSWVQCCSRNLWVPDNASKGITLREKCPYSELIWSVFSQLCIEFGPKNLRIQNFSHCHFFLFS